MQIYSHCIDLMIQPVHNYYVRMCAHAMGREGLAMVGYEIKVCHFSKMIGISSI